MEALYYALVLAVVFGGTLAMGIWAARVHDRAYPRRRVRFGERGRRFGWESRFTWLSGGRG